MSDHFKSSKENLLAEGSLLTPIATLIRQTVHAAISRMNLVTREEFEVQTQVLLRTRLKVEQLEKKLIALTQDCEVQQALKE